MFFSGEKMKPKTLHFMSELSLYLCWKRSLMDTQMSKYISGSEML